MFQTLPEFKKKEKTMNEQVFALLARGCHLTVYEVLSLSATCNAMRRALWDDERIWTRMARRTRVLSPKNSWTKNRRLLVRWSGSNESLEAKLAKFCGICRELELWVTSGRYDARRSKETVRRQSLLLQEILRVQEGSHQTSGGGRKTEFVAALEDTLSVCIIERIPKIQEGGWDDQYVERCVLARILRPSQILFLRAEERTTSYHEESDIEVGLQVEGWWVLKTWGEKTVEEARFVGRLVWFLDKLFDGTEHERPKNRKGRSPWFSNWKFDESLQAGEGADGWDQLALRERITPAKCMLRINRALFPKINMRDHVRTQGRSFDSDANLVVSVD